MDDITLFLLVILTSATFSITLSLLALLHEMSKILDDMEKWLKRSEVSP